MVEEVRNAYADALQKSPLAAPDAKTSRQGVSVDRRGRLVEYTRLYRGLEARRALVGGQGKHFPSPKKVCTSSPLYDTYLYRFYLIIPIYMECYSEYFY